MLVFTEGEKTEPHYISHRYAASRDTIAIEFGGSGAPTNIVDEAIAAKQLAAREQARGAGRSYDEIWCVFDADQHAGIDAIRRRAVQAGVRVAFSNPCLELWFVLHFEAQTAAIASRGVQRRSGQLLVSEKVLDTKALAELDGGYDHAVERARALDGKHELDGSPAGTNPSTGVWTLTERMRTARDGGSNASRPASHSHGPRS